MSQAVAVYLDKPIVSAALLDAFPQSEGGPSPTFDHVGSGDAAQAGVSGPDVRKMAFSQACQALNAVTAKLNESLAGIFSQHKEEIARLSVEIARKVLMQKVSDRDYQIEAIVQEALGHTPSRQDLVVHLNPDDLAECRKAQQQDEQGGEMAGIQFVPDPNIGRAECLLESPKGIIKSLIDEHLERIGKALGKAE